jgi:chorismate synthase
MELILETAGESHGAVLTAILAGIPAGSPVDEEFANVRLRARQRGYGRSARQRTEQDRVRFTAGVRDGHATGNPIAIEVANRDTTYRDLPPVTTPRPGHADLAGALNRGVFDARDVVERASARETAVRTAAGAVAAQFLEAVGIRVLGHVLALGGVRVGGEPGPDLEAERRARDESDLHALGPAPALAEARARVDDASRRGDTLGGVVQVVVDGAPPGLGGHERPEEKLSARLAAALVGVQAVRAVEIGLGAAAAARLGSEVHDAIGPRRADGPIDRGGNAAGGIEGGTSNGERIVVSCAMKPLSTLRSPLPSVDLRTGSPAPARVERSDVTAVPALAIVAEAVVALELARAVRRRFGGAHLEEVRAALAFHRGRHERLAPRSAPPPS